MKGHTMTDTPRTRKRTEPEQSAYEAGFTAGIEFAHESMSAKAERAAWGDTGGSPTMPDTLTPEKLERTRAQLKRPTFRANTPAMGLVADSLLAHIDALTAARVSSTGSPTMSDTPTTPTGWADHDIAWDHTSDINDWAANHEALREGCQGCAKIARIEAEARTAHIDTLTAARYREACDRARDVGRKYKPDGLYDTLMDEAALAILNEKPHDA